MRRILDKTAPRFDLVNGATTSVSNLLRSVTAFANDGTISGFAEMRRHGWNVLQLDSSEGGYAARLVVAPDRQLPRVRATGTPIVDSGVAMRRSQQIAIAQPPPA